MKISCEIDKTILHQNYFNLQKKYHPDYSKNRDIDISLINKGYEILSNKLLRLKHILEINDIAFNETITDTEFLMQCMEWQENKNENKNEITKQIEIETKDTIKQINLKNFISASNYLQKAIYLDKLLQ